MLQKRNLFFIFSVINIWYWLQTNIRFTCGNLTIRKNCSVSKIPMLCERKLGVRSPTRRIFFSWRLHKNKSTSASFRFTNNIQIPRVTRLRWKSMLIVKTVELYAFSWITRYFENIGGTLEGSSIRIGETVSFFVEFDIHEKWNPVICKQKWSWWRNWFITELISCNLNFIFKDSSQDSKTKVNFLKCCNNNTSL